MLDEPSLPWRPVDTLRQVRLFHRSQRDSRLDSKSIRLVLQPLSSECRP